MSDKENEFDEFEEFDNFDLDDDETSVSSSEDDLDLDDFDLDLDEDLDLNEELDPDELDLEDEDEDDLDLTSSDDLGSELEDDLDEDMSMDLDEDLIDDTEEDFNDVSLDEDENLDEDLDEDLFDEIEDEDLESEEENSLSIDNFEEGSNIEDEEEFDLEEEFESDLSETKGKDMDGKKLVVENHMDETGQEAPKKSNKLLMGVVFTAFAASSVGGAYYAYSNGLLDSMMEGGEDDFEPTPKNYAPQTSSVSNDEVLKKLQEMKLKMDLLEAENKSLKKNEEVQKKDMLDFKETLDSVKKNKVSSSLTESEISGIVDIVEAKTGKKISEMEGKLDSLESSVEEQSKTLNKAVKVSLHALKEAKEVRKSQEASMEQMNAQIEFLKSFTEKVENDDVSVSADVLNKITQLEDEVKSLKVQKTEKKGKVTIPVEVEIKKAASVSSYSKAAPKKSVEIATVKYYSMVGLAGDVIYLRDVDGTGDILDYAVGDHLDGYGEILSISRDGKIRTDSGVVKYK